MGQETGPLLKRTEDATQHHCAQVSLAKPTQSRVLLARGQGVVRSVTNAHELQRVSSHPRANHPTTRGMHDAGRWSLALLSSSHMAWRKIEGSRRLQSKAKDVP